MAKCTLDYVAHWEIISSEIVFHTEKKLLSRTSIDYFQFGMEINRAVHKMA